MNHRLLIFFVCGLAILTTNAHVDWGYEPFHVAVDHYQHTQEQAEQDDHEPVKSYATKTYESEQNGWQTNEETLQQLKEQTQHLD